MKKHLKERFKKLAGIKPLIQEQVSSEGCMLYYATNFDISATEPCFEAGIENGCCSIAYSCGVGGFIVSPTTYNNPTWDNYNDTYQAEEYTGTWSDMWLNQAGTEEAIPGNWMDYSNGWGSTYTDGIPSFNWEGSGQGDSSGPLPCSDEWVETFCGDTEDMMGIPNQYPWTTSNGSNPTSTLMITACNACPCGPWLEQGCMDDGTGDYVPAEIPGTPALNYDPDANWDWPFGANNNCEYEEEETSNLWPLHLFQMCQLSNEGSTISVAFCSGDDSSGNYYGCDDSNTVMGGDYDEILNTQIELSNQFFEDGGSPSIGQVFQYTTSYGFPACFEYMGTITLNSLIDIGGFTLLNVQVAPNGEAMESCDASPCGGDVGPIAGCTNEYADNYNPEAEVACYFPDGSPAIEGEMYDDEGNTGMTNSCCEYSCGGYGNPDAAIGDSDYGWGSASGYGDYGAGCSETWTEQYCNEYYMQFTSWQTKCDACPCIVLGCTDPEASNYNPEAEVDDGSCEYDIEGCTDINSINYNPEATIDDGSCIPYVFGCPDSTASNYNPEADCCGGGGLDGSPCSDVYTICCEYDEGDPCEDNMLIQVWGLETFCVEICAPPYGNGVGTPYDEIYEVYTCEECCVEQIYGCTNPLAANFNDEATLDDGSCIIKGCTDPNAINYNPDATDDDGSCEYPEYCCYWNASNIAETIEQAEEDGYDLAILISTNSELCNNDLCSYPPDVYGCMDENAINYNEEANIPCKGCCDYIDDLSCEEQLEIMNSIFGGSFCNFCPPPYGTGSTSASQCECCPILGCTDSTASNYNPEAEVDDGSCISEPIDVCEAFNELEQSTQDTLCSLSCPNSNGWEAAYCECCPEIEGCTNETATNYNSNATIDDGSCIIPGCTNETATNYNPDATIDDGFCIIEGCTDNAATNYNSEATIDNGSCEYPPVECSCLCGDLNGSGVFGVGDISMMSNIWNDVVDVADVPCIGNIITDTNGNITIDAFIAQNNIWNFVTNDSSGTQLTIEDAIAAGNCFNLNGPGGAAAQALGCIPEEITGCTDELAINYNAEATTDDGSCEYEPADPCETYNTWDESTQIMFCDSFFNLENPEDDPQLNDILDGGACCPDPGPVECSCMCGDLNGDGVADESDYQMQQDFISGVISLDEVPCPHNIITDDQGSSLGFSANIFYNYWILQNDVPDEDIINAGACYNQSTVMQNSNPEIYDIIAASGCGPQDPDPIEISCENFIDEIQNNSPELEDIGEGLDDIDAFCTACSEEPDILIGLVQSSTGGLFIDYCECCDDTPIEPKWRCSTREGMCVSGFDETYPFTTQEECEQQTQCGEPDCSTTLSVGCWVCKDPLSVIDDQIGCIEIQNDDQLASLLTPLGDVVPNVETGQGYETLEECENNTSCVEGQTEFDCNTQNLEQWIDDNIGSATTAEDFCFRCETIPSWEDMYPNQCYCCGAQQTRKNPKDLNKSLRERFQKLANIKNPKWKKKLI